MSGRDDPCTHEHLSETFTWMNDVWQECKDCGYMDSPSWFDTFLPKPETEASDG